MPTFEPIFLSNDMVQHMDLLYYGSMALIGAGILYMMLGIAAMAARMRKARKQKKRTAKA